MTTTSAPSYVRQGADTLAGVARSRPALFLVAMTGVGFIAGRVIRSGGAEDEEPAQGDDQGGRPLDPRALDALSRRIWPGESDDRRRTPRAKQMVSNEELRR